VHHNEAVIDLLACVRQAGGTIRRHGDKIELTAPAPLPPALVARIRAAKPALLAVLNNPSDWHMRHQEALAYWSILHAPDEAVTLAWDEMQIRWHRLHGERFPVGQCAGCGGEIRTAAVALDLADGTRVHLDDLRCLTRYGDRWRYAATLALVGLGMSAPATERS